MVAISLPGYDDDLIGKRLRFQIAREIAANQSRVDPSGLSFSLPYDESFFKILKDYTMTGYFLSETGATQALAYLKIPGGFQGDIPLAPNQKAWAI